MKQLILFAMLVNVLALGFSQSNSWAVNSAATWIEAVGGIRSGGNNKKYEITVTGNISVPMSSENTFGTLTGITIAMEGNGTITLSSNGALLRIGNGQTVIVKDLTLQGRNQNSASVVRITNGGTFRMQGRASVTGNSAGSGFITSGVHVNGGIFFMEDNSSVINNSGTNASGPYSGGGVSVDENGTFNMQGGTISGNTITANAGSGYSGSAHGGGVFITNGTFNMRGGTITRNIATSKGTLNAHAYGGGVCIRGGTFNMQGGTITANTVSYDSLGREGQTLMMGGGTPWSARGGGVYVGRLYGDNPRDSNDAGGGLYIGENCSSTMSNAIISGNTAHSSGAGVDVYGSFTMTGGEISGNKGGGVDVYGIFTMKNGKISGNGSSTWKGGGVCLNSGSFTMENGEISGNTASSGGGVYVTENSVFNKTGGIIYDAGNGRWRNATAETAMNTNTYGFWLND
jgi:hypothetical protein